MITKWKVFESEQNWSIKKYGFAHAVYYKGVIVGFDDKEIANEEGVNSYNLWTITLRYSTDINDSEDIELYVPNYVGQMFQLEDEYDISPIVKTIAGKLAEKLYQPGFFIELN